MKLLIYRNGSALTYIKWLGVHGPVIHLKLARWIWPIIYLKLITATASIINLKLWAAAAPVIHLKLRLWCVVDLEVLMHPILLKIRTWSWSFIGFKSIWRHSVSIIIKLLLSSFKIIALPNRYVLRFLKIIFLIVLYKVIIWSFVHIVRIAWTRFLIESIIICFRNLLLIISFEYRKLLLLSYWVIVLLVIHLYGIIRQWFFKIIFIRLVKIIGVLMLKCLLLCTHCIRYSWMYTALSVVIKLFHLHLFCYLLVLHVIWCCLFHLFEFLLVFYFFHYFHSFLWFQSVNILLFQYSYFLCLLRLNFSFFPKLWI